MTRARWSCIFVGLLLGLLFYLAYRSDYTLSNRLLRWLCGTGNYLHLKQEARRWLLVPACLRGALPSALWCFVVTNLLGGWKIQTPRGERPLAWIVPLMNAGWEAVQALHWTDGCADWLDVLAGFAGCWAAELLFCRASPHHVAGPFTVWRITLVAAGVVSMGMADVWK
jgi:hypothetical protein